MDDTPSQSNAKKRLSDLTHNLRTPMSVIWTLSETALLDETLSSDVRSTFIEILNQVKRLTEIANVIAQVEPASSHDEPSRQ